jgi:4-amino-4-deoxy-L-arabinose transferase-like glycosyltransferase
LDKQKSYHPYLQYSLLVLVLTFTGFLQFFHLGQPAIVQWDESRLAVNAAEMYQSGNYLVSTYENEPDLYNTKPPLMIWLQVASIHAFGLNEFAIRFPSALAGFLCILMCGYIVFRHGKNIYTACFAILLLACSKGFIQLHGSLTGDYDSMLALFLLSGFYHFYTGFISQGKKSSRIYFLLFLSLAVMCKSAAALIAFPVFIISLLLQRDFLKTVQACALCTLSLVPFLVSAGHSEQRFRWAFFKSARRTYK